MAPWPDEYGPVPWSVPRPMTLWLAAALVLVIQLIETVGSWARTPFAWTSLILAASLTYLMLRGSKLMWTLSIVFGSLGIWGSIQSSFSNRGLPGHHFPTPNEHLAMGILTALFVLLLLLPSTMRFFDLDRRKQLLESAP